MVDRYNFLGVAHALIDDDQGFAIDRTDGNVRVVLRVFIHFSWISNDACHILPLHFTHEKLLFSVSRVSDNQRYRHLESYA